MAPKTFYPLPAFADATQFLSLQEGGAAPAADIFNPSTGFRVVSSGTVIAAGQSAQMDSQATVIGAAGGWSAETTAPKPLAPDNVRGNAFRTSNPLTGSFAAGNWSFSISAIAVANAVNGTHRFRVRVYRSPNADGSGAVELTTATLVTTTTPAGYATTAPTALTVTWTAPAITLNGEYLFFAVAAEVVTAATNAIANRGYSLYQGSSMAITTADFAGVVVQHAQTFALAAAFQTGRVLSLYRTVLFALSLAFSRSGSLRLVRTLAFALSTALSTARGFAWARTVGLALSATFRPPAKAVSKILPFALGTSFSPPRKVLEKIVRLSLSASSSPRKIVEKVLRFAVSAEFRANKFLSKIVEFPLRLAADFAGTTAAFVDRLKNFPRVLRGRRGRVQHEPGFYLSNARGEELKRLRGISDATVDLSNFRDTTWQVSLNMRESDVFDPLSDYLLAVVDIETRKGNLERFPLGLYRFKWPGRTHQRGGLGTAWALTGYSPEMLLMQGQAIPSFTAAKGQGILATVRQILRDHGVPASMINFPPGDKPLRNSLYFDPFKDNEGAYWLRICNALLAAGGFGAIQTNAAGQFFVSRLLELDRRQPSVHYGREGENIVVSSEIPDDYDDDRFANRILAYQQNTDEARPLFAVRENRDPNSQGSIDNLGYVVQKSIGLQDVASQEDLDLIAAVELGKSSGIYRKVGIETVPDPRRGPDEVYELSVYNRRDRQVIDGVWNVINWQYPLKARPEKMTHNVSRVEGI